MNKDVIIIGGGPAGIQAAISASKSQASVLLIERDKRLGGILKQCIHDGFGLEIFAEKLTGPEYSEKFIEELEKTNVEVWLSSFVSSIEKIDNEFDVQCITREGIKNVKGNAVIVGTGCRERTAKQIYIHGSRPSGVFTAGLAQYYTNILGKLPTKKCVILGSGDIGLIMARRLTLEGAKVLRVLEIKNEPSGLPRNIEQCLNDYDIPLFLNTTVTRVFGENRLEAVEIAKVDDKMIPIESTKEIIECDALILSVGLIPENELLDKMNVKISPMSKGPIVDQNSMTSIDGLYSTGNSLHVNDLVDYVTMSAKEVGFNASKYKQKERKLVDIYTNNNCLYLVPHVLDINSNLSNICMYFRSSKTIKNATVSLTIDGVKVLNKKYNALRPPEMKKIIVDLKDYEINESSKIKFDIEAYEEENI